MIILWCTRHAAGTCQKIEALLPKPNLCSKGTNAVLQSVSTSTICYPETNTCTYRPRVFLFHLPASGPGRGVCVFYHYKLFLEGGAVCLFLWHCRRFRQTDWENLWKANSRVIDVFNPGSSSSRRKRRERIDRFPSQRDVAVDHDGDDLAAGTVDTAAAAAAIAGRMGKMELVQ